jgi:DNA (cytosine-5)-methyltransferase 1
VIYGSVCSGIEAATVAWHPLGWRPAFFAEIEKFPRALLAHHYPDTPCHGDFTTIEADQYGPIDLLVGGTPCQSFSIAGLRGGLDDDRGNLALEFLRLADRKRPRWLVWENVPGVLSSNGGRDFGAILGGMVELGYGIAYRVLDAQFFGVPQRRRRVFVVGCFGDWASAAAVLFERHSLSGHPAPRREKGQIAPTVPSRSTGGGGLGTDFDCDGGLISSTGDVAHCLNAGGMGRQDYETETLITHAPVAFGTTQITSAANYSNPQPGDPCHPLAAGAHPPAVAFAIQERAVSENPDAGPDGAGFRGDGAAYTLEARTVPQAVATTSAVRRLTPRECERLQGFPDDYTLIPWRGKPADACPDGPRYKALGNSMAVPVMRWIGERIQMVENLTKQQKDAA